MNAGIITATRYAGKNRFMTTNRLVKRISIKEAARYFKIRTPALLVALNVTTIMKIDSTTETAAIAA
jgi:hypothetical protein